MTRAKFFSLSLFLTIIASWSLAAPRSTVADTITFGTTDIPILLNAGPQTEGAFQYKTNDFSWEVNDLFNSNHALWTQFNSNTTDDFAAVGQQVEITSPGNVFKFLSVDYESASSSSAGATQDVRITGLLGNQVVGTLDLTGASPGMLTTATSPFSTNTVDKLLLEMTTAGTYGLGLDNFVLTPMTASVPEPTSLALLGMTFAGFFGAGYRRRRKAHSAHAG